MNNNFQKAEMWENVYKSANRNEDTVTKVKKYFVYSQH